MSLLSLDLNYHGHKVRMVGTVERPEWVAKDVCRVLSLTTHNAGQGIPDGEKGHCVVVTPGGPQDFVTVSEAGLYRLVSRSRTAAAQRFQSWLFGEVLPSIRKHGRYPAPPADTREQQLAAAVLLATQVIAERDARLAISEPKAAALDRLSAARGDVNLQDAGRVLGRQPNRFVATLIEDGLLFRGAHGKPEPYAQWRDAGYFRVRISEIGGDAYLQTLVTPKGLAWLAGRYPQAHTTAMETSH